MGHSEAEVAAMVVQPPDIIRLGKRTHPF